MIYFMIAASIIVADKIAKEYFKSSFRGKHRKKKTESQKFEAGQGAEVRKVKEEKLKQRENNNGKKEKWENIRKIKWINYLSPTIELLENKGAASGILEKHPIVLKIISATMLCVCVLALGKERKKGKTTMAGIGYALLLGGGFSNFIDRMKKGSVTDYVRFPEFPVKKISNLVFNLSDFCIFAGVFCLLFRKNR